MKKFFCAALLLILLAGLAQAGLAEAAQPAAGPGLISSEDPGADGETPTPDAPDSDEGVEDLPPGAGPGAALGSGRAVDVDGQYTFSCPAGLTPMEIERQELDDGFLFSAFSDTMGVDVYKYEQGEDTLDSLYEVCKEDDSLEEVALADIGGVRALVYRIDETGVNVTLAGDTGYLYDIMITYQTLEEYQQMGALIASIKKAGA